MGRAVNKKNLDVEDPWITSIVFLKGRINLASCTSKLTMFFHVRNNAARKHLGGYQPRPLGYAIKYTNVYSSENSVSWKNVLSFCE